MWALKQVGLALSIHSTFKMFPVTAGAVNANAGLQMNDYLTMMSTAKLHLKERSSSVN